MNYLQSQLEALVRIAIPTRNDRAARRAVRAEIERLRAAGALRIGFALLAILCVVVSALQRV
jgi:hypothetical protein